MLWNRYLSSTHRSLALTGTAAQPCPALLLADVGRPAPFLRQQPTVIHAGDNDKPKRDFKA